MNDQKLYTVGDMATICNIPARQLRYYDQIGVIKPGYRNPENGYRYYTEDQIANLVFLGELKKIGISNDSIQRLFMNRDVDQFVQELQVNLAMAEVEIENALSKYKRIVNALVQNTRALAYLHGNDAIESEETDYFWISVAKVQPMHIIFSEHNSYCGPANAAAYVHEITKLNKEAENHRINTADLKIGIYHNANIDSLISGDLFSECSFDLAREIKPDAHSIESNNVKVFGGFHAVSTVSVGYPSRELPNAYSHIKSWGEQHGFSLSNEIMEEYLFDPFSSGDSNRFVTKIYVPILNYEDKA